MLTLTKQYQCDTVATWNIGVVFTPKRAADFAIEKFGLLDLWFNGKTVFDPTMGEGNLLESLVDKALERGKNLSDIPLRNLFGVECNSAHYNTALAKFNNKYNIDMSNNFFRTDILTFSQIKADVLFGNPPWCNFADLPPEYKEFVKPFFLEYGLVQNKQKLLLGGSRIDIAALVIQKTIADNLQKEGSAVFFLPLSILLNDGAHESFRHFSVKGFEYALKSVYDFADIDVFGVSTRFGLAEFEKKAAQDTKIPYFRHENGWKEYQAQKALDKKGSPYIISSGNYIALPQISVPAESKPRQGVNTCGANSVFIFTEYENIDKDTCSVASGNKSFLLPKKFVYPLLTANNFSLKNNNYTELPRKWVLLPYDSKGKPLHNLSLYPFLEKYLETFKDLLIKRKGVFIQAQIRRGLWWALLGVGSYNFTKYKVVWEAYGKKHFLPRVFEGAWQANQSLQAFIPCADENTALRIQTSLQRPEVEQFLLSSKMEGTMSWAQPGKIMSLLKREKI
jgi:hypothetical protein